ncbi:MAG TPA: MlaD family protein [Burkholderiales bacterium]|jgi:phospholipid/cholesterol/gamma-HCH transport system substrate-binding protein
MESRAYALVTGLFVLGIAGCIVVWAHWLAKAPIARTTYRVVSTVPVAGLNPEAQVRYRGMGVGRVSSIALDEKDPRRILVNIEVDSNIPVTRGTYAQLGMEGITGIAYVHLLDSFKDMQPAVKGADGLAELPLRPSFFDALSDDAEGAMRDARELMGSLNGLLTPDNRKRIATTLASLERISANLETVSARLPAVVARSEAWLSEDNRRLMVNSLESVNETAKTLPELARDAKLLVKDARELVGQVGKLSDEAHDTTGSVREETLPRVNALAESVERSAQRVGRLALRLDREPQSAIFGRKPGKPGPGEPGFQ